MAAAEALQGVGNAEGSRHGRLAELWHSGHLFCTALCGPVKILGFHLSNVVFFLRNRFSLQERRRKAVLLTPSYSMGKPLGGMDLY